MLTIVIPDGPEGFNEGTNEFIPPIKGRTIQLEHSLVSISKWESKWHKPFISKKPMSRDELVDYIRCMTITPNVPKEVYSILTSENYRDIQAYIDDSMTASTVKSVGKKGHNSNEQVTSELIYYWMIAYGIPSEYQKWHLNRLMMLIRICEAKNRKPTKRPRNEVLREYDAINDARRKALHSKG